MGYADALVFLALAVLNGMCLTARMAQYCSEDVHDGLWWLGVALAVVGLGASAIGFRLSVSYATM